MSASPNSSRTYVPSVASIEERATVHEHEQNDWEDDQTDDETFTLASESMADEFEMDDNHLMGEGDSGLEIEFEILGESIPEEEDEEDEGDDTETEANQEQRETRPVYLTRSVLSLLAHAGIRQILQSQGWRLSGLDDSDDELPAPGWGRSRRRANEGQIPFEKVPSDVGRSLMWSGTFGSNDRLEDKVKRKKQLAYRVLNREMGLGSYGRQAALNGLVHQDLIPSSKADMVIHYNARCYSGQFSNDGNFFFSCGQDFKVRLYDTSNPYRWEYYKAVDNPYGQWTITDASLSSDNKWLAYSSISRIVCLASTDPLDDSEPRTLDFSRLSSDSARSRHGRYNHFGIWSIRFSGDGREIVAGTGDSSVYVFDIEKNESILRIPGHDDDVNAVCFGDAASPHILYSGSDDTTLKVWDRRSLGDGRAAGVFLGHTEGLTYVDSKGDGRYIISNGKDQTAKLWDLRKVISTEKAAKINPQHYSTGFEYRMAKYDFRDWAKHPHDCSLVTFRGHQVLKTLIRCHFSPPGSTDSRYVYSGSYDGSVYIWNLDATFAGKVDVGKATTHLKRLARSTYEEDFFGGSEFRTCVRDASWHPYVPMIAGTYNEVSLLSIMLTTLQQRPGMGGGHHWVHAPYTVGMMAWMMTNRIPNRAKELTRSSYQNQTNQMRTVACIHKGERRGMRISERCDCSMATTHGRRVCTMGLQRHNALHDVPPRIILRSPVVRI